MHDDNSLKAWNAISKGGDERVRQEVLRRVQERLKPEQQRAVVACLVEGRETGKASAGKSLLKGLPYFVKDLFDVKGYPTLAGSSFLAEKRGVAQVDSKIVQVLESKGALLAGKTQMHEFAYGLTGENPFYGDCVNPLDPTRTTGGSSSGSAAAVAAGIVPFSVGTDTGGSVRVPAAFCGLFGFRLQAQHEWIQDAFPLAPSCDSPGWFTQSAQDMLCVISELVGLRGHQRPLHGCFLELGQLDAAVAAAFREAASRLCPEADETTAAGLREAFRTDAKTYSVLTSVEASEVHSPWLRTEKTRYSPAVWNRIERGLHWSLEDRNEAAYMRQFLTDTLRSYFATYDFLVLPATPCAALRHEECASFNRERILELSAPASLAGLPVLTIPVPLGDRISTGLQVITPMERSPAIYRILTSLA